MTDPYAELKKKNLEHIERHKKILKSQPFQNELKYLDEIAFEFLHCVHCVGLFASLDAEFSKNSFLIRCLPDFTEAGAAIKCLVQQGCHNPVKREIRFLLESGIKYIYVDQKQPYMTFEQRLDYFIEQVPRSRKNILDEVKFCAFNEQTQTELKNELKSMYSWACSYVHPSKNHIEEREIRYNQGVNLGFESVKELRQICHKCFQCFDLIMTILLHGIGPSSAGDYFPAIEDISNLKMLKGKYINKFNHSFDYKAE